MYETTIDPSVTFTTYPVQTAETVLYPSCQRGDMDDNWAHEFHDYWDRVSGRGYIYCRRCGLVQRLEL